MALTDYIGIRGLDGDEPFQGIGGGAVTLDPGEITLTLPTAPGTGDGEAPGDTTISLDTTALETVLKTALLNDAGTGSLLKEALWTGDLSIAQLIDKAFLLHDGEAIASILDKAFLLHDGSTITSIMEKAWLLHDGSTITSIMEKAWLLHDGSTITSIMEKAWLLKDGDTFFSILEKAWLLQDESILKTALLYEQDGAQRSVLKDLLEAMRDRLADLAFVDAVLDFGFLRVHIKGKTIEYLR